MKDLLHDEHDSEGWLAQQRLLNEDFRSQLDSLKHLIDDNNKIALND